MEVLAVCLPFPDILTLLTWAPQPSPVCSVFYYIFNSVKLNKVERILITIVIITPTGPEPTGAPWGEAICSFAFDGTTLALP